MKQFLLVLCTGFVLFTFSCKSNDDDNPEEQLSYTNIDVVTGLNLTDPSGAPIGQWRSPNSNRGDIAIFPNPAVDVVFVSSQNEDIRHIRIVAADCLIDSTTANIPELSTNLTFTLDEIEAAQLRDIPVDNFNGSLSLDFSDLPAGFYKVFFEQTSGDINWENIYLNSNSSGPIDFEWLDNQCN